MLGFDVTRLSKERNFGNNVYKFAFFRIFLELNKEHEVENFEQINIKIHRHEAVQQEAIFNTVVKAGLS
jgi:hypothetical protein